MVPEVYRIAARSSGERATFVKVVSAVKISSFSDPFPKLSSVRSLMPLSLVNLERMAPDLGSQTATVGLALSRKYSISVGVYAVLRGRNTAPVRRQAR